MSDVLLSLSEAQTLTALRTFLIAILPANTPVVRGQVNRVPEVTSDNFVVMTPTFRERLSTNVDDTEDAAFTGAVAGNTLTVTAMALGEIVVGRTLFGTNVLDGTLISAEGTGTGGVGTYTVSKSQTVTSRVLAAGAGTLLQPVQVTVQLDVHGEASADSAQRITTLFRDDYGVAAFEALALDVIPLYTSEPRQLPFVNENQQVENRWSIDALLQCNPLLTVPQQYTDKLSIDTLINVDVAYPPT